VPDRFIGRGGERKERIEKRIALALEQAGIGQELSCGHGPGERGGGRPNDRTERQIRTDELARLGHDLVGDSARIQVEIREHQPITAIYWWSVAGFVVPDLEVSDL